jgi:hypothetical protein
MHHREAVGRPCQINPFPRRIDPRCLLLIFAETISTRTFPSRRLSRQRAHGRPLPVIRSLVNGRHSTLPMTPLASYPYPRYHFRRYHPSLDQPRHKSWPAPSAPSAMVRPCLLPHLSLLQRLNRVHRSTGTQCQESVPSGRRSMLGQRRDVCLAEYGASSAMSGNPAVRTA